MAHIDSIWFNGHNLGNGKMRVYVKLKPAGEVRVEVPIPEKFFNALMNLAQTAADNHEAQMRAEILGDSPPPQPSNAIKE